MDIKTILAELQYNENGKFPQQALEQAIARQEEITPELLKIIEYSKKNIEELNASDTKDRTYFAIIWALYLLAQFRETRAYPLIIDFFSLPGESTLDMTGDVVTESLGRILASVYDGNLDPLKALVENKEANEYVRTTCLRTMLILLTINKISRGEIIDYLRELFHGKLEREFSYVWNGLISVCTDLYPEELMPEIKQAFADEMVEPFFINLKNVEDVLAQGKERTLSKLHKDPRRKLIDDTIGELKNWACFRRKRDNKKKKIAPEYFDPQPPYKNQEKIGRNDPCPCGSGKKYKKCCLRK